MGDRENSREQLHEGFFARWSQRKLRRRNDDEAAPLPEASGESSAAPPAEAPARASVDKPLPPVEILNESSDFSGFLAPGVDEELQRLALRKLFGAARFNIRDGLDDYDEDYRSFEALGNVVTADMRHRMARDLNAELPAPPEAAVNAAPAEPEPAEEEHLEEEAPAPPPAEG